MALQTSGKISLLDIKTEFGAATGRANGPFKFSDYYRGAGLVPDIAQNANVPASGKISLSDFYGAVAQYITEVLTETVKQTSTMTYSEVAWQTSMDFITEYDYTANTVANTNTLRSTDYQQNTQTTWQTDNYWETLQPTLIDNTAEPYFTNTLVTTFFEQVTDKDTVTSWETDQLTFKEWETNLATAYFDTAQQTSKLTLEPKSKNTNTSKLTNTGWQTNWVTDIYGVTTWDYNTSYYTSVSRSTSRSTIEGNKATLVNTARFTQTSYSVNVQTEKETIWSTMDATYWNTQRAKNTETSTLTNKVTEYSVGADTLTTWDSSFLTHYLQGGEPVAKVTSTSLSRTTQTGQETSKNTLAATSFNTLTIWQGQTLVGDPDATTVTRKDTLKETSVNTVKDTNTSWIDTVLTARYTDTTWIVNSDRLTDHLTETSKTTDIGDRNTDRSTDKDTTTVFATETNWSANTTTVYDSVFQTSNVWQTLQPTLVNNTVEPYFTNTIVETIEARLTSGNVITQVETSQITNTSFVTAPDSQLWNTSKDTITQWQQDTLVVTEEITQTLKQTSQSTSTVFNTASGGLVETIFDTTTLTLTEVDLANTNPPNSSFV